ncbi:type IV pilin, partial [Halorubrum ezzemoulense]|uniref:archaellin/type IV pilin N-terminal domain-containing protein n=1 Tax=Halorubrum ezzemoulense TaxID=337243 RepID=UPI00232F17CA
MKRQDRAVTPVISTILMVAIVVILAATASVFFFDIAGSITEPAPNVSDTAGEFEV